MPTNVETLNAFLDLIRDIRRLLGTDQLTTTGPATEIKLKFVTFDPIKFWPEGTTMLQMTDLQQCVATVAAVSTEGNPASFDSPPTWNSANPGIVTVTPSADGLTAVISSPSPGPLGTSTVTVIGTSGGTQLTASADVEIISSAATSMTLTFGTPT